MSETDLQLGGGYTYQWECAILLALNYFFEPVRYNPVAEGEEPTSNPAGVYGRWQKEMPAQFQATRAA